MASVIARLFIFRFNDYVLLVSVRKGMLMVKLSYGELNVEWYRIVVRCWSCGVRCEPSTAPLCGRGAARRGAVEAPPDPGTPRLYPPLPASATPLPAPPSPSACTTLFCNYICSVLLMLTLFNVFMLCTLDRSPRLY